MICIRCSTGFRAVASTSRTVLKSKPTIRAPSIKSSSQRTFSSFTPLRPALFPSFRPNLSISKPSSVTASATTAETPLDLLPKISSHPALGATQIRCGPRNTFNPSHFVRKRRHGFLSRVRTRKGRATLQRRRLKKRSTLSH